MALVLVLSAGFVHAIWIPLHLLTFFAGAVACHGALARRRPPARYLSTFYMVIALGGLLGGVFNAILVPDAVRPGRRVSPGDRAGLPGLVRGRGPSEDLDSPRAAGRPLAARHRLRADGPDRHQPGPSGRFGPGRPRSDARLGPRVLCPGDGAAAAVAVRARVRGGAGGERPDPGRERPATAHRAELLRRGARDRGCRPHGPSAIPRQHAPRPAEPRPEPRPRALDVLHAIRADRPALRGARIAARFPGNAHRDRRPRGGHAGRLCPARRSAGRSTRSIPPIERIARDSAVLHLSARLPGGLGSRSCSATPGCVSARRPTAPIA